MRAETTVTSARMKLAEYPPQFLATRRKGGSIKEHLWRFASSLLNRKKMLKHCPTLFLCGQFELEGRELLELGR